MRKVFFSAALLTVTSAALSLAPLQQVNASGPPLAMRADDPVIQHVVIVYQENHTFDDVLGAVCATRTNPCDGYTGPVTFADGTTATNIVQPDVVPEVDHSPYSQKQAEADNWDAIDGCTTPPYPCISHVDPADIPNLAALADTFTVSDATFAAGNSASFGAHVTLAAGTMDGFVGNNPVPSRRGVKPGPGWGCPSDRDVLWGTPGHTSYQPSCIPDENGQGPYRHSKVPYAPTIMQRLEDAGLTWHVYAGPAKKAPSESPLSFCTYFTWCFQERFDLQHNSSTADFLHAAASGTLPTVSFLIPAGDMSQHNGLSMTVGDNYIGSVASALENSPEWDSSAMFITYDDCGCFYDHVTPPTGLGLRNPMVIVSPWARPQFTDSTTAVQPYSMLAFIQHTFSLGSLNSNVDNAYDYANAFDFGQRPLRGPVMTTRSIPPGERARIARSLPLVDDDPT